MEDTALSLHTLEGEGEGGTLGNSKLKVPSPDQIFIVGGGSVGRLIDFSGNKVLDSDQN